MDGSGLPFSEPRHESADTGGVKAPAALRRAVRPGQIEPVCRRCRDPTFLFGSLGPAWPATHVSPWDVARHPMGLPPRTRSRPILADNGTLRLLEGDLGQQETGGASPGDLGVLALAGRGHLHYRGNPTFGAVQAREAGSSLETGPAWAAGWRPERSRPTGVHTGRSEFSLPHHRPTRLVMGWQPARWGRG